MAITLTPEELLKEVKRCYRGYRSNLKRKSINYTKHYEGQLDVYEELYKKAGGEYEVLDKAKEEIDELLGT